VATNDGEHEEVIAGVQGRPARLVVLISGGGTTLLNFLQQIRDGQLPAEIPLVISSQHNCRGVERAQAAGLPVEVLRRPDYSGTPEFSDAVFAAARQVHADYVVLAGFLSLLQIPADFQLRVLNIHPSLIPAFCGHGQYGHHVHEAAIARGVRISGCTVHFADNQYDHGPIILQRSVEVPDHCTADQLAGLVFQQEKLAYPEALRRVISGRLRVRDGRTFLLAPETAACH
jgi:formyltetrahydrofolate-dependent phosphoribosylglycinamide formyltransferase